MTTINRATWVDDDGSGATGTIINNARLQGDIYDRIDQGFAALDTKDANQDTSIAANGPHKILSANHTDSLAATLVTGDLLRADATGKLARLPVGTNGQLLSVVSGLPAYVDPAAAPGLWQSYTPIWAATTTPPVLGNGTIQGRYMQIGKTIWFTAFLQIGSTSTFGAGYYSLSLPVPVAAIVPLAAWNFPARINDASAGSTWPTNAICLNANAVAFNSSGNPTGGCTPTSPMTWAVSDVLSVTGCYETP